MKKIPAILFYLFLPCLGFAQDLTGKWVLTAVRIDSTFLKNKSQEEIDIIMQEAKVLETKLRLSLYLKQNGECEINLETLDKTLNEEDKKNTGTWEYDSVKKELLLPENNPGKKVTFLVISFTSQNMILKPLGKDELSKIAILVFTKS